MPKTVVFFLISGEKFMLVVCDFPFLTYSAKW